MVVFTQIDDKFRWIWNKYHLICFLSCLMLCILGKFKTYLVSN